MNDGEHNHLLASFPPESMTRLLPHLELVALPLGKVLYEPGGQLQYAYFPISCIASLHYVTASGVTAETASVGNEGVVGVALFMGGNTTSSSAVVRTAGQALRIERRALKAEFDRGERAQQLLLLYTQALIAQISQTAVCNRHHSVDQQLCRWLLMTADRVATTDLVMTQELVAHMLGVRREGITLAAGKLQAAGCIRYRRGHITLLDRGELERRVCECYGVVKQEMARLLTIPATAGTNAAPAGRWPTLGSGQASRGFEPRFAQAADARPAPVQAALPTAGHGPRRPGHAAT